MIQLVDHGEDALGRGLHFARRAELASDAQVHLGSQRLRNQCIRRLLNAVVRESVSPFEANHKARLRSVPERRVDLLLRALADNGERREVRDVAEAGELLQRFLGRSGQALQLHNHQFRDVVRVALGADACDVPVPRRNTRIE